MGNCHAKTKKSRIKAILSQINIPLKYKSKGNVNFEIQLMSTTESFKIPIVFEVKNRNPSNKEDIFISNDFVIQENQAKKVLNIFEVF